MSHDEAFGAVVSRGSKRVWYVPHIVGKYGRRKTLGGQLCRETGMRDIYGSAIISAFFRGAIRLSTNSFDRKPRNMSGWVVFGRKSGGT